MATQTATATMPYEGTVIPRGVAVLVATDGRAESDAALAAARVLAEGRGQVGVLTVLPLMPIVSPEVQLPVSPELEQARVDELRARVSDQVQRVLGDAKIPIELRVGDAGSAIARAARESNAQMIVVGIGRHRIVDRLFGDETALRLLRVSPVSVLAVAREFSHAPERVVIAMDFSAPSMRAAQAAIDMAADSATLYLAHVGPRESAATVAGAVSAYPSDAGAELDRTRQALRIPSRMAVQRIVLHGDVARELLAFASSVNADLIATGSHGHGFIARMLIGSVATKVLRGSTCSVLVVPPAAPLPAGALAGAATVTTVPQPEWAATLDRFTQRNLGRRGLLQVDDPEIGAQAQEQDYPLLGATYDHHDGRVELMFGELGSFDRHLTRSIGQVSSIDVLTDTAGRDVALRVAHGAGQTLLTFSR